MRNLMAVLLVMFAVVGCGHNIQTVEENFVDIIRETHPEEVRDSTDQEIISLGYKTCRVLNSGMSVEEFANELINGDVDPEFAGTVLGASIRSFCPEHVPELDEFIDKYSTSVVA